MYARTMYIVSQASLAAGVGATLFMPQVPALWMPAAILVACGGVGIAATAMLLRRATAHVVTQLCKTHSQPPFNVCQQVNTGFEVLNRAWADVNESAARALAAARLRVRELELQLRLAAAERQHAQATQLAEVKNDFVSMVSHELRTPLASIKAYVEMLIDGEAADPRTQHQFYDVIQSESNRLGRLIDNILNISRIESGAVHFRKKPEDLRSITLTAIGMIKPQAAQKRIALTHDLPAGPCHASVDRSLLDQVLVNLLSNAVKYTLEGGSVHVGLSVDPATSRIVAQVTDTGVGIQPEDLPRIFEKFFRSETTSRMAPGTGLGLALVKHIVETVHGGRLFVKSEVGKGSCFGFELGLGAPAPGDLFGVPPSGGPRHDCVSAELQTENTGLRTALEGAMA